MGHCLDYIFIDKKKWEKLDKYKITANDKGILTCENISENEANDFYFDALNDKKSSKKEYERILYDDYLYQDYNGLKEQFASDYAYNNGKPKIFEDWAESVSMVSFDKLSKKEQQNALIWNEYDEELDLKTWRRLHKKRYEYFLNLLEDS